MIISAVFSNSKFMIETGKKSGISFWVWKTQKE